MFMAFGVKNPRAIERVNEKEEEELQNIIGLAAA